ESVSMVWTFMWYLIVLDVVSREEDAPQVGLAHLTESTVKNR
ncbi:hypothetical protein GCK32_022018, partial [Trichostrongylus colubriformis]